MNSCLYHGTIRHKRMSPRRHEFEYRLFMLYLDLAELPELFDGRWLWSARRPAPAWFRRADYLGDPAAPLEESVRLEALRLTGRRPTGPVRLLTHVRYLGYVQNPVTFYYCFAPDGGRVETILAQVTNTPWGERHTYVLTARGGGPATAVRHDFDKAFHVSPFMDMDQRYSWWFSAPGRGLTVHMESSVEDTEVFEASLVMQREEINGRSLARALVRFPWMTGRVAAAIYWQAARLWWKGAPFHPHPRKRAA